MDADDQDKLITEPDSEQEDAPEEPTPGPAAPPRIVAETPIGGKVRTPPAPRREETRVPEVKPPAAEEKSQPEPQVELPKRAEIEVPAAEVEQLPIETKSPEIEVPAAEAVEAAKPPAKSEEAPQSPSVVSTSEVDAARPEDWDDDISPELASLLFKKRAPREEAKAAAEGAPAAESAPAAEKLPPAEPIHLTQIAEARLLPITAEGVSAPAPQIQPEGKARYQRVEEPLDDGQRTSEQWDYRGPDYPALNEQFIKRVVIEETTYTDGSWYWTFERSYTDGGWETREIRANIDRTYIERTDEIKAKDAATGKQVKYSEKEAMILAGPPREEKRGLLNSLLGRGENNDGPKAWRVASSHEAGHARKEGGEAFKRKTFGLF